MKLYGQILFAAALTAILATAPAYALCVASTSVSGTATPTGASMWTYDFSVLNGCALSAQPFLTDFYIPYFADAGIADILLPAPDTTSTTSTIAWTATIDPTDNLFDLAGAGVIDFQVTATPELEVSSTQSAPGVGYYGASGFSFTSTFAPVAGPYAVLQYLAPDYTTTRVLFGDPPIPGSPDTIAALSPAAAPEPSTVTLLIAGLFVMSLSLQTVRRRRSEK